MNREINFTKMHGIGNDFVLINSFKEELKGIDFPDLAIKICDRNFGVGADGLIIVWPSETADVRMQIFNPDGSEPEMCGNGIRCFAKYFYEDLGQKKEVFSVETKAGIMVPAVILKDDKIIAVEVDMGIPQDLGRISLHGFEFVKISMGNPHAITFLDDLDTINLSEIGPVIEVDFHFLNKTNVEFAKIVNEHEMKVKVWERSAGETLACGTGACAAVAAAVLMHKTSRRVFVHLPGGILDIEWQVNDNHIIMRGPAERVFEGKYLYLAE